MIQIAVMGYGTVGSGVVEVLNTNQASIDKRVGEEVRICTGPSCFPGRPGRIRSGSRFRDHCK